MTDARRQIADHLRFYGELGVIGVNTRPTPSKSSTAEYGSRTTDHGSQATDHGSEATDLVRVYGSGSEALAAIRADVGDDCSRCKLHALGRKQIVFGVGDPTADLMFVGEAPGADEDIQGIPFVGRAGQLLTKMIEAINLKREQVYIANVIKCRPPGNRNPEPDEIAQCQPFLFGQIEAVKPKVIVALGSFAAKTLLRSDESISRLRGRIYDFHGAKLIPTFHPSFLLRSPDRKRDAWEDLKKARALLAAGPKDPAGGDKG